MRTKSRHTILPIVMGARQEEYEAVAPFNSFIHVDQFKGPKELAMYLLELDKDDEKYNQYFQVFLFLVLIIMKTCNYSGEELESLLTQDSFVVFVLCYIISR